LGKQQRVWDNKQNENKKCDVKNDKGGSGMNELLSSIKMSDVILMGVILIAFVEVAKKLLPDNIENSVILLVSLTVGIIIGLVMGKTGLIDGGWKVGVVEGILTSGIVSGSISFVFELISKARGEA